MQEEAIRDRVVVVAEVLRRDARLLLEAAQAVAIGYQDLDRGLPFESCEGRYLRCPHYLWRCRCQSRSCPQSGASPHNSMSDSG